MDYIAQVPIMGNRLSVQKGDRVSGTKLKLGKKSLERYLDLGYLVPVEENKPEPTRTTRGRRTATNKAAENAAHA